MEVVRYWYLIGISWWLCCACAHAADEPSATTALTEKLGGLHGVVASFNQQISNAQGLLVEQSTGHLYLDKPRFRWEVAAPFPQIIIADGEQVQVYDPDLEQVTERVLGDDLHEAPLALLTQDDPQLDQHYTVSRVVPALGIELYTLTPKAADALFERMQLEFENAELRALLIFDHTGQQTQIRFTEYQAQQVIQSSFFELEYPPGTDFVRG